MFVWSSKLSSYKYRHSEIGKSKSFKTYLLTCLFHYGDTPKNSELGSDLFVTITLSARKINSQDHTNMFSEALSRNPGKEGQERVFWRRF